MVLWCRLPEHFLWAEHCALTVASHTPDGTTQMGYARPSHEPRGQASRQGAAKQPSRGVTGAAKLRKPSSTVRRAVAVYAPSVVQLWLALNHLDDVKAVRGLH